MVVLLLLFLWRACKVIIFCADMQHAGVFFRKNTAKCSVLSYTIYIVTDCLDDFCEVLFGAESGRGHQQHRECVSCGAVGRLGIVIVLPELYAVAAVESDAPCAEFAVG